jgi:hypothetical protein
MTVLVPEHVGMLCHKLRFFLQNGPRILGGILFSLAADEFPLLPFGHLVPQPGYDPLDAPRFIVVRDLHRMPAADLQPNADGEQEG